MNILDLKRKLLPMSGFQSGGGSSPTQTQVQGMPKWAEPYAQETLAKQAALSDVPYQAYGGERIQGFSPLQQQAQQQAGGMGTSGITGQVAQRGLNTQTFGADQASQYMNPYMQNVVDIQKREAARQSGIQGVAQAGQATQAGALGGSRDAIMRAERERNLGQQMGDIQAVGSNAAYTNAQNQFNADQARNMQGLGLAAGAGQQEFQQGIDVNRLQAGYGAQQQALGQQGLTQAYQDFQTQKQYPQTQLTNMAAMMRGLPIGGTTTTTGTPGSPSDLQTLGGIAQIGYGLSKFMADGGVASSYADGGSVDSEQNIAEIVHRLSDQQLAQAEQAAKARGDAEQLQAIAMEKAARVSMQRGLGAAPVDMAKMLPTQESMARGGIIAFAKGGTDDDYDEYDDSEVPGYTPADTDTDTEVSYNPNASPSSDMGINATLEGGDDAKSALGRQQESLSALRGMQYKAVTPEEEDRRFEASRARLMKGVDNTDRDEMRAEIERMKGESGKDLERGKGLALIQSGAAMFEGNDFKRALAKSAGTFSQHYGEAIKANQAKNNALLSAKQNLVEAKRKEDMGLNREAVALTDQARKDEAAAQTFEVNRLRSIGILEGNVARNARGAAAKSPTALKLAEQLGEAEVNAAMNPDDKNAQTKVKALRSAVSQSKSSFSVADIGGSKIAALDDEATRKDKENAAKRAQELQINREAKAAAARKTIEEQVAIGKDTRKLPQEEKDRIVEERLNKKMAVMESTAAALPSPAAKKPTAATATAPTTAADFAAKWAKLPSGQSLVGPDGKTYTKK